jgi:RNA polymerase sigma factor (sigma-70 family)
MAEIPVSGGNVGGRNRQGTAVTDDAVSAWFVAEIISREASLMHYLQHNWRNASDIADLRQEVYARVFEAARERIPDNPKHFLLVCARNLLIDLVRREQVVPIEAIADIEGLNVASDAPQPDRSTIAREELRQLKSVLRALPARAREAITLAYFEGLTGKEIAARMGVTKSTASKHLAHGMRILTDLLHGPIADRSAKS